jgi:glyoxylase-like metal-dependent hydrolase (beta-lactamase superfamily II)
MAITNLSRAGATQFALSHTYEIDGRVSWHPPAVRGTGCVNCYFLRDGDDVVLVDTGLSVHQRELVEDLEALDVADAARLSLILLRQGEFDSICNAVPIMRKYDVDRIFGLFDDGHLWADFREDVAVPTSGAAAAHFEPARQGVRLGRDDRIAFGGRELEAFFPPLRLLNTYWLYDPATLTLFTSDVFTHRLPESPRGPFAVGDDRRTDADEVRAQLLETRYWWLAGAELDRIRAELAAIFEGREIQTIAPSFGCVIDGTDAVALHYGLLDEVLADLTAEGPLVLAPGQ